MKFRLQACWFWIALSLFPLTSGAEEANGEWRERIVAAYLASADVLQEFERLQAEGFAPGEIEMVNLGGGCGVAGCGSTFLVVRTFTRPGVNPQTPGVPALVTVRHAPGGELGPVRLAEIVPKKPDPPLSGEFPPSSPQLRVERKIPAPAPQLRRTDP